MIATVDASAGHGGRGVHHQPGRCGTGADQPSPSRRRPCGRGRVELGQCERGHGRAGRADALRMCELTAQALVARPPTSWCARPGSSASRCPWTPIESGVPKLGAQLSADVAGGTRPPTRFSPPTPSARSRSSRLTCRCSMSEPSAAWRRAPRCWRPRWPRCSRCSRRTWRSNRARCRPHSKPRSTRASTRWWSTPAGAPTTRCWSSPTARPPTSPSWRPMASRSPPSSRR